jgi:hypothetical protein
MEGKRHEVSEEGDEFCTPSWTRLGAAGQVVTNDRSIICLWSSRFTRQIDLPSILWKYEDDCCEMRTEGRYLDVITFIV